MNETEKLNIFRAQIENVRALEKSWKYANRTINLEIINKNEFGLKHNTKILCLIYCALAEAIFSKLIHTPYGLSIPQIEQIKLKAAQSGVKEGWLKCVELAMKNVAAKKSNHNPNVQKKLKELINQYIFDPSLIRNKLAHGQWIIALNRENTDINQNLTDEIKNIDIVELYRRKNALEKLSEIIEDIIESPNKAHMRDYQIHLENFQEKQSEMDSWSLAKKISDVRLKYSYRKA
jgi:hypothetical protein